jgi:hypothetical protein
VCLRTVEEGPYRTGQRSSPAHREPHGGTALPDGNDAPFVGQRGHDHQTTPGRFVVPRSPGKWLLVRRIMHLDRDLTIRARNLHFEGSPGVHDAVGRQLGRDELDSVDDLSGAASEGLSDETPRIRHRRRVRGELSGLGYRHGETMTRFPSPGVHHGQRTSLRVLNSRRILMARMRRRRFVFTSRLHSNDAAVARSTRGVATPASG